MADPERLFDIVHGWTYGDVLPALDRQRKRLWQDRKIDLRMALRRAKRFVLDDAFIANAVRTAAVRPEKMLNLCHLANLPFDKVWLEFNNNARIDAQYAQQTGESRDGEERGQAGFLLERVYPEDSGTYQMTGFGMIDGSAIDEIMPTASISYLIDVHGMLPPSIYRKAIDTTITPEHMRILEEKMRSLGWGYTAQFSDDRFGYACSDELIRRAATMMERRFFDILVAYEMQFSSEDEKNRLCEFFVRDCIEQRGNLRFIMALLAMINTVPIEYRHRQAKGFYRRRLRNVPYLESHEISIVTGRTRLLNVVDSAIRHALYQRHNKRHEVRGHWALAEYGKGGRGCAHEAVERDGKYALCGNCHRLLVWKDHTERGDAELGYVEHTYRVKR